MLDKLIKGDSEVLDCDLDADITDWEIRCEIYDDLKNSIVLKNTAAGGSDDEILVTNATDGKFQIQIKANTTTDFNKDSKIEIEVTTTNIVGGIPEVKTIYQGDILFKSQRIK